MKGYGNTAIDNKVHAVPKRAGIARQIGNHTLRRTCGRLMFYSGVPIEKIAAQLGHSDTKTTMRYLGLMGDDPSRTQENMLSYLDQVGSSMKCSRSRSSR